MDLKELMGFKNFVVVGKTLDPDKYAYKIKQQLLLNDYNVECVYQELKSIDDVSFDIDVLNLCINPVVGLKLLKQCNKNFKCVLIQPGAESEELIEYLKAKEICFLESCSLVGITLYSNKKTHLN